MSFQLLSVCALQGILSRTDKLLFTLQFPPLPADTLHAGLTNLCIWGNEVQGSDLKVKLPTLGKLPDTRTEADEALPSHIGSSPHYGLAARG